MKKSLNDNKSLISVVITCYNQGEFLHEAIDSVLSQTYKYYEIILIDDGSTDNTAVVAKRYVQVHYHYQANGGPSSARNKGKQLAKGDYLLYLDADDRLSSGYIEQCLKLLQDNPKLGFVFTQVHHFGIEQFDTHYPDYDINVLTKSGPYINISALQRLFLVKDTYFDEGISTGYEDWDYYLSLYERGVVGQLLNKPALWYRRTGQHNQISYRTTGAKNLYKAKLVVMRKHSKLFSNAFILRFTIQYWVSAGAAIVKRAIKKVIGKK